jgi:UDP-N-acetylglucosamine acyltransferase
MISRIEDIYRILYVKGYTLPTALKEIQDTVPDSEEKSLILKFIEESKNGIIKGPALLSKSKAVNENP